MRLSIENVSVVYPGQAVAALRDVSLQIKRGEFVAIVGSSGAGKSTLVRCVNMLVKPTTGTVLWNGQDLTRIGEKRLRSVRAGIGMVFQQFQLVPRLNVLTNVLLGTLGGRSAWRNWLAVFSPEERERAREALDKVGLASFAGRRVETLSGGQQQRVAIARAMMQNPLLMLGDEPVSSLDPVTSGSIMELLLDLHQKRDLITIVNLHNIDLARRYATRIIGLSQGRVVFDGGAAGLTPDVLRSVYRAPGPDSPTTA